MEKKRRESAAGWVFESNEGQSNQEAEVTWRLLGRSLGMWLQPVFFGAPSFRCSHDKANTRRGPGATREREIRHETD
jgi:hypothetical protein